MAPQREWFEKDYYAVLGVASDAPDRDIARAYKKLAKRYHPDANQGNPEAEEKFKEVSAAYDVLGDPEKRREYDEVRQMVAAGVGPGFAGGGQWVGADGGLGDVLGGLGGLFGRGRRGAGPTGPRRGQDLATDLHLSFTDAVEGVTSVVRFRADAPCDTCGGSGARPGTGPERCGECGGSGSIALDQGPFSFSQICPRCGGSGLIVRDPCPTCRGRGVEVRAREVKVRVPAGVADGQRIRVKGRGAAGRNGGPAGDLYVTVHVGPHHLFGRRGRDLVLRLPVTFAEAALGAEIKVPTLHEPVTVRIPPGTPSGKTLRVRGRGIPSNGRGQPGDLLVTVEVEVPRALTEEQRAAVEALDAAFPEDVRAHLPQARASAGEEKGAGGDG